MLPLLTHLKRRLKTVIDTSKIKLGKNGNFAKRIKYRHTTFWNASDAEKIRNSPVPATHPIDKWKEGKYWQRKLSNKYNAREFAKLNHCKVPDLYWRGRDPYSIGFDKLPPYYVIRPTIGHSCDLVFLISNAVNLMDKQRYSFNEIKAILSKALKSNHYLEFLIEEFVRTEKGEYKIPDDYKFYMFNGEVAIIEVINRLSPTEGSVSYYDKDWNMTLGITNKKYLQAPYQSPPSCFSAMLEQAKKLSKTYEIFVRIDFYATNKGAVFGEFTATPGSSNFLTTKANDLFLSYWEKYCKGKI